MTRNAERQATRWSSFVLWKTLNRATICGTGPGVDSHRVPFSVFSNRRENLEQYRSFYLGYLACRPPPPCHGNTVICAGPRLHGEPKSADTNNTVYHPLTRRCLHIFRGNEARSSDRYRYRPMLWKFCLVRGFANAKIVLIHRPVELGDRVQRGTKVFRYLVRRDG